ncbi:MAG: hypothetical protein ACI4OY_00350 [Aristaeellaceae bacterium]
MMDQNTQDVLARAARLTRLEAAAAALDAPETRWDLRAGMAAALAALLALLPAAGAAQMLL